MSTRFRGFALLAILAAAVIAIPAFAQQENPLDTVPITVTTDKGSYADGETITISGETKDYISGLQVSVVVINPIGNVVTVQQVDLETDKTYSTSIIAGGGLWKAAGTYTIKVQYGSDNRSSQTTFGFSGSSMQPKKVHVENTDFDVSYSITGGKVLGITADVGSKSLVVSIQTTSDGTLTITLPRGLIDAKINDTDDDNFFVLIDGEEVPMGDTPGFDEEKTSTDRTLTIHFQDGAEEIEIIGTWIIPEFGAIAALVLAVAIISIIAVSAKTRLRLMPKY